MVKAVTFEIAWLSRSVFYTVTLSGKDLECFEILEWLKGQAIKTKDLAERLWFLFERNVGKILENLRMQGIPVLYHRNWVFLCNEALTIEVFCEEELYRSKQHLKRVTHWSKLMLDWVKQVSQTKCCEVPKKPWYRKLFGSW